MLTGIIKAINHIFDFLKLTRKTLVERITEQRNRIRQRVNRFKKSGRPEWDDFDD